MRILAVAQNTFREAIRDKILYVLLFFAAATILGSKALGWISIGQDIKIVKDLSLAAMSVFGVLIAIFIGTIDTTDSYAVEFFDPGDEARITLACGDLIRQD